MIEFQCPGCLHHHAANAAFAGLRARCIVCGVAILVPSQGGGKAELAEEGPSGARRPGAFPQLAPSGASRSASSRPIGPPKPSRPASRRSTAPYSLAPDADAESEAEGAPGGTPGAVPGGPRALPFHSTTESDADIDLASSDSYSAEEEAPEAPKKPRPEPKLPAIDPAVRRKNLRRLGIAGVLGAIIVVCGVFLFSGKPKPKPTPPPQRDDTTAKAPEPPPPPPPKKQPEKKVEPPKVEPPKVVMEQAPPPHLAGEIVPFAATLLVAERAAAPHVFDKNLEGRRIMVRGALARLAGDSLVLGDSPEDTRNAITCVLRKGVVAELTELKVQPGQAVVVSGVYAKDLRVQNCEIVQTTLPTDEEFKDRVVELTGVVQQVQKDGGVTERFPTLFLTPPTTDPLISVRCLFRLTEREKVATVKVGQTITVRGRCEGRLFRVVRFHDCSLADTADPPTPGLVRVATDKFFAAYETDLLPVPRPGPDAVPVVATAEQLTEAFADDLPRANATYRHKVVQVSGKLLSRSSNTAVLETGTGHRYQIELVFTPTKFALLRDEAVLTARGVCTGVRGGYIRFENAERYDADLGNATVRTTAEYLPFTAGRELTYEVLSTGKPKDNPILRVVVRAIEPDLVRSTPTRSGTFAAPTLFGDNPPEPRWLKDLTKQKGTPVSTAQHRFRDDLIAVREIPTPPAQPSDWWDPVFRVGAKKDESWTTETPDRRTVTYTVMEFRRDESRRQLVEIRRIVKDPKEPGAWEESLITYALGIGEIRRVVIKRHGNGKSVAVMEVRLVKTPSEKEPIDPEKDRKDGP